MVAQVAVFLHGAIDDFLELGRNFGVDPHRRHWCAFQNGVEDHPRGVASERQLPGGHLIQHCPEGKQVSSSIQILASDLFRRHVSDGAKSRTRAGEMLLYVEGRRGPLRSRYWFGRELG